MPSLTHYLIPLVDEVATRNLAETLANRLRFCVQAQLLFQKRQALQWHLHGNLGSGKTTFVRALLRACGYHGRVKSPTYTLCESYNLIFDEHRLDVYHFDLYRLSDLYEWDDAGFRDVLDQTVLCLLEWPERISGLTVPDISMTITYTQDLSRMVSLTSWSIAGQNLLMPLAEFSV